MDVAKYRQLFLDESRDHLLALNRDLLALEQQGADAGVDGLFRAAHSIKGMAGSMGYDGVVTLSHALEDVLDRLRKRTLEPGPAVMSCLYGGVDALGAQINEIAESGGTQLDAGAVVERLRAAARGEAPPVPAPSPAPVGAVATVAAAPSAPAVPEPAPPEEAPDDEGAPLGGIFELDAARLESLREFAKRGMHPYACEILISRESGALGARNFVVLGRLARTGTVLATSPTIEEVRAGAGRQSVEALLVSERPEEALHARLAAIPEVEEVRLRRLRIEDGARAPRPQPRPAPAAGGRDDRYAARRPTTVRVDTRVLDALIDTVGELLITRERLQDISRGLASPELGANLERLRVLVREFQDTIMTVRMMPLALVTDRLPRIVRDLAYQSGKQLSFEVSGQNIQLDRAILEELNDVLLHLVRNALDHGLEGPEDRVAAGKPAKGAIRLRAGRERDWVWIRVEDDGRGMDPERIARAAVERGLVSAERVAEMEEREKLLLCCLPGVSTAERVTDISGRGVGMDVVKARVDAFGGTVQIESRPGNGAAVTLRLPLTLAIVRVLLVEVRGRHFGLPVSHIVRTFPLDPDELEWSQRRPTMQVGERRLPMVDLGALLGLVPRDLRLGAAMFVAVSQFGTRAAALAVDRLLGTHEVVIKPLGLPLKRVRGLAGVTVMGDGRLVLLLDLAALV